MKHKFKPGDLVRHKIDADVGIVVDYFKTISGNAYRVYWVKGYLGINFESFLKKVNK